MTGLPVHPLAVVLAIVLAVPSSALGDPPICDVPFKPPERSARLGLRGPEGGEGVPGLWLSEPLARATAARITSCEKARDDLIEKLAKEQVDHEVDRRKISSSMWPAWVAAGVGAATLAYFVGRATR